LQDNKYDSFCLRIWFSPLEINIDKDYEILIFRELIDEIIK